MNVRKIGLALVLAAGAGLTVGPMLAPRRVPAGPRPAAPAAPAPTPAPAARPGAAQVEDPAAVYRVPVDGSPVRGPADALVTVVEVMDLECPFCKRASPTLRQLEEAYPGKLRLVFKHNPLSMHPGAIPAAVAVEEARARGGDAAFWAVGERLLALPKLDRASIEGAAAAAGLPASALKEALDGGRHLERIRRDQLLAASLGAGGTPTFFVNGRKIVGAQPLEAFKARVDEELAKAQALVKQGVRASEVYDRITAGGATAPRMIAGAAGAAAPPAVHAAKVTVRPDDPIRGRADAPVTVVLFSDFQCPFCSRVGPTLEQLEQAYPGKVRIVWKHQPLPFHPNALPAARAAEAARAQGKFWPMHDRLFASQAALGAAALEEHARQLGLDLARFGRDAGSAAGARRIGEDQALAASVGATGTPTLFVNCRKIVGAKPLAEFKVLVDQELSRAEALVARGEKLDAGFYDRICAANVAAAPPAPVAAAARTDVKIPLRPDDAVRGEASAPVTIVEFSDFQCPFCARAAPAVSEVEAAFGRDVRIVWKHLPLPFHQNALPAALAAEAAREQGKFWPMHDRLFGAPQALTPERFEQHARELGLDVARFRASMAAPATRRRVEEDAAAAAAAGVTGTPTFVVNGEVVLGSNGLRGAVERQLERARARGR